MHRFQGEIEKQQRVISVQMGAFGSLRGLKKNLRKKK